MDVAVDCGEGYLVRMLLAPLDPFLNDPEVTEVLINKPGELRAITKGKRVLHRLPVLTLPYLDSLATALISYGGPSGTEPGNEVSVMLPGGERGHIVRPPHVLPGRMSLTIRKHAAVVKTMEQLGAEGVFDSIVDVGFNQPSEAEVDALLHARDMTRLTPLEAELLTLKRERRWLEFFTAGVRGRRNFIMSGKPGSGKTTALRSFIEKVPEDERILTLEDVHELLLQHPDCQHLFYGEGGGRMSASDLIAACLRMSADRVFLSELRGAEALALMDLVNTGHPGSITSVHANSAIDTYSRVALLAMKHEAGRSLGYELVMNLLRETIDVVVYMENWKVTEVFYDPIFVKARG